MSSLAALKRETENSDKENRQQFLHVIQRLFRFLKKIVEEKHLILHRITPVGSVMRSGTGDKIVRDISVKQFFMQSFVHLIKKVIRAAIDDDFQRVGCE